MKKYNVGLISLGCDKNRIDSEIILGKVSEEFTVVNDPEIADILIINTCGFIGDSKQESIDTILEMAKYKEKNCKLLMATGCLTQRYKEELQSLMPEIDVMLGVNDYANLDKYIKEYLENNEEICVCEFSNTGVNEGKRILTTDSHSAYIRISEGCNNFCTYCIIPKIRGKYRSRKFEHIISEAKELVNSGVKELILVGQDTTLYGIDLYDENQLHILLRELSKIQGIEWIRLLYCYPEELTEETINEIALNDKVCNYLDIPIQHINNEILKRMNRKSSKELIISKINSLREKVEDIVLRTSLIVGFPGETEEQFNELRDFVEEIKLDKLGVFSYSIEEETPAAKMKDHIDEEVKIKRREEIMALQQTISTDINTKKIKKIYDVIIEGKNNEYWFGRNYEMSPEIDGYIYFKCDKILNTGEFIKIQITEALEYDLVGVVYNESCQ